MRKFNLVTIIIAIGLLHGAHGRAQDAKSTAPDTPPAAAGKTEKRKPTLFIVGDSTVKNGTRGQVGWGEKLGQHFDASKISIQNRAIAGRSSRTFMSEGRWDQILAMAQPCDFVLIQMGHNDGGPIDDGTRARGSLRGLGEETQEIDNSVTKKHEVVHTFGWYMRKYVADTRAKNMTVIICSPVPHCPSKQVEAGAVEKSNHVAWSEEVAKSENVPFIQLNRIIMGRYSGIDPAEIKSKYFLLDTTHSSPEGAELNAKCVIEGIQSLKDCPLASFVSDTTLQPAP